VDPNRLSDAILRDEIVVHFQPIVGLEDLVVHGAEGLVRWEHPELGTVPPIDFVPIAEQSGLIGRLTEYVLTRAVTYCGVWRDRGHDLSVSVNVSPSSLVDEHLPDMIEEILSSNCVPPDALTVEITEQPILPAGGRVLATIARLKSLGVRLSIDNFGTGHSSLASLKRLPFDELKIDRSFVTPMLNDKNGVAIVESTIKLAHGLDLRVVAEGVEDERTMMRLAVLGADQAQGFHISKPLPPRAFGEWLAQPPVLSPSVEKSRVEAR
jgi:EAL domain-containing protein (putative c-di-GMP-specific phosphodiesterase class I)